MSQSTPHKPDPQTFYDTHIHAMNLSHPNILAFVNRIAANWGIKGGLTGSIILLARILAIGILILLVLLSIPRFSLLFAVVALLILLLSFTGPGKRIAEAITRFIKSKVKPLKNLLAVMENDPGSFFQVMEECVKHDDSLFKAGELKIDGHKYTRFVLVPLIMDFGYKNIKSSDAFHYGNKELHSSWGKPVKEQIIDLFNGIKSYKKYHGDNGTVPLFDIYPFMGMNPQNYELKEIDEMLRKYFGGYQGLDEVKYNRAMEEFGGDIGQMGDGFFAGIKLYPPLGFDPWPDDTVERQKVELLYGYCCDKKIPVTTHCNPGGFTVVSSEKACQYTAPSRWEKVLENEKYQELKLNFAHFGCQLDDLSDREWFGKITELILRYDNVYTDISFCGIEPGFYGFLKNELDKLADTDREKIKARILFGSDYMINLLSIESYKKYLDIFSGDRNFTSPEKNLFCSVNPQKFLF